MHLKCILKMQLKKCIFFLRVAIRYFVQYQKNKCACMCIKFNTFYLESVSVTPHLFFGCYTYFLKKHPFPFYKKENGCFAFTFILWVLEIGVYIYIYYLGARNGCFN